MRKKRASAVSQDTIWCCLHTGTWHAPTCGHKSALPLSKLGSKASGQQLNEVLHLVWENMLRCISHTNRWQLLSGGEEPLVISLFRHLLFHFKGSTGENSHKNKIMHIAMCACLNYSSLFLKNKNTEDSLISWLVKNNSVIKTLIFFC